MYMLQLPILATSPGAREWSVVAAGATCRPCWICTRKRCCELAAHLAPKFGLSIRKLYLEGIPTKKKLELVSIVPHWD